MSRREERAPYKFVNTDSDFKFPRYFLKNFRWYRKRKGGTWSLVKGYGKYWVNREPLYVEHLRDEVYEVEEYD